MSPSRKIVLTGGPGVGKTSILQHLRSMNYEVREEVFTRLFAEAQQEGRFNDAFLHSPQLVHELLAAQIKLEALPSQQEWVFLDRSRIDILGFSRMQGILPLPKDQVELEGGDYDLLFIVEPLPSKFYDQNAIRRQSFEESLEHHLKVTETYTRFLQDTGKDPEICLIRVPFFDLPLSASVQRRTQFVLDEIRKRFEGLT